MTTQVLLLLGLVFLVFALAFVYRVFTLLEIANGEKKLGTGVSNRVNALLFPIAFVLGFGAIFYYSPMAAEDFLPVAASEHGVKTDYLFWVTMAVIFVAFIVTHLLLFFFPYVYQYNENRSAFFYPHNDKLEIVWTVIPAVVMAVLVINGWTLWTDMMDEAEEDAVTLEIMGKQFNWIVRYPGQDNKLGKHDYTKIDDKAGNTVGIDFNDVAALDDFMPPKIVVPKGQEVNLKIRSRDVLHSVFLPHFRVKMDAVPGMPTSFHFIPTMTTEEMRQHLIEQAGDDQERLEKAEGFEYEVACTEICGNGHFAMRYVIEVVEPEAYNEWLAQQDPWVLKDDFNAQYVLEENFKQSVKDELRSRMAAYKAAKEAEQPAEEEHPVEEDAQAEEGTVTML